MELLHTLFFTALTLGILVTFHEFGHYWVARQCGVRVLKFSIGFGKPLIRWQRGDTEFALAAIPLGGYVKMFGESTNEGDVELTPEEEQYSFSHKTVWQRIAIVAAGPLANFLLAILFYWVVFLGGTTGLAPVVGSITQGSPAAIAGLSDDMEILAVDGESVRTWNDVQDALLPRIGETGIIEFRVRSWGSFDSEETLFALSVERWQADAEMPDLFGSLGIVPFAPPFLPVVDQVMAGSAAEKAGLQTGDRIQSMNGEPISEWEVWRDVVRASPSLPLQMTILRDGRELSLEMIPESVVENDQTVGRAGVVPKIPDWPETMVREVDFSVIGAFGASIEKTWDSSVLILSSLKKMVTGMMSTKSLGGPITIAKYAGTSAEFGWQSFLAFLAILSVSLGVLNLLPIPVLDGGHLLFYCIEAIKGSPLTLQIQGAAYRVGLTLLLGIMLLALYNDFARL